MRRKSGRGSETVSNICQRRIIWTPVADKNGHNRYPRPVIILTPDAEMLSDPVYGVVASHTAWHLNPRPDHYIELPYHRQRMVMTRLSKPTVVICDWIVPVTQSAIADLTPDNIGGVVPPAIFEAILQKRAAMGRTSES